jgi:hypothetical protein
MWSTGGMILKGGNLRENLIERDRRWGAERRYIYHHHHHHHHAKIRKILSSERSQSMPARPYGKRLLGANVGKCGR